LSGRNVTENFQDPTVTQPATWTALINSAKHGSPVVYNVKMDYYLTLIPMSVPATLNDVGSPNLLDPVCLNSQNNAKYDPTKLNARLVHFILC